MSSPTESMRNVTSFQDIKQRLYPNAISVSGLSMCFRLITSSSMAFSHSAFSSLSIFTPSGEVSLIRRYWLKSMSIVLYYTYFYSMDYGMGTAVIIVH